MNLSKYSTLILFIFLAPISQIKAQHESFPAWIPEVDSISIVSSVDGTAQPSLIFSPETDKAVPLLVGLHTWSGNFKQPLDAPYAEWCKNNDWAFIHPNYRGPNSNPGSAGSDLVVADVIDAVNYMREYHAIDNSRIYLIGGSGGGYNALQVVAKAPDIWTAVSVWVPISDMKAWYYDNIKAGSHYAQDQISALGGAPGDNDVVDIQYIERSPIYWLQNATGVPISIGAGINDGHTGSVPIRHSLNAFNKLANVNDRIPEEVIDFMVHEAMVPDSLSFSGQDPDYPANKQPLFRRESDNVTITIFEGAHDILFETGLRWLSTQEKGQER